MNSIVDVLIERAESVLPGLSDHIEVMTMMSPRTVEQFVLTPLGSFSGFDVGDGVDVDIETISSPIDGLFMSGVWVSKAGGISLAMTTGIQAVQLVLARLVSR